MRDLRMADFALLLATYDDLAGTSALDAYRAQVESMSDEALDGDAVATAVVALMDTTADWRGLPSELLERLEAYRPGGRDGTRRKDDTWPATAQRLTSELDRAKTGLRRVGIVFERCRRTKHGRDVWLRRAAGVDGDDGVGTIPGLCLPESAETDAAGVAGVDGDDASHLLCSIERKGDERKNTQIENPLHPLHPRHPLDTCQVCQLVTWDADGHRCMNPQCPTEDLF